jgi:hypothetical protein
MNLARKIGILLVIGVLLSVIQVIVTKPVGATHVAPTLVPDNPSCFEFHRALRARWNSK